MRVADFHFDLPEELIAQHPPAERGSSRMLCVERASGAVADDVFAHLPARLQAGDVLVLNDSRVLPARLYAVRRGAATQAGSPAPSGRVEVLLTGRVEDGIWKALVRPARKVVPGEHLLFPGPDGAPELEAEVLAAGEFGERTLRFQPVPDFHARVERIGHLPLPPYIHRPDAAEDRERYQTVYAQGEPGSAAAPTAGLHFTPAVLEAIRARGVEVCTVTLHVGLGTFQPVRVADLADIRLHREHYTLPAATAEALNRAQAEGRRVVAAGTTTTRTLEHCAAEAGDAPLAPHSGETGIFLSPGHRFRLVSGLLTNFHLPESTLLMLVAAFLASPDEPDTGRKRALAAYAHAVSGRYRFFSYGDAMLIL